MTTLHYALKPKRRRAALVTVAAITTANMNLFFVFHQTDSKCHLKAPEQIPPALSDP